MKKKEKLLSKLKNSEFGLHLFVKEGERLVTETEPQDWVVVRKQSLHCQNDHHCSLIIVEKLLYHKKFCWIIKWKS